MFIDSTGRAYSVGAHTLPSARGQGEPLAGHFNPPDGSSFRAVLIGEPDDRWVVASSAGYGFVVRLEELHSNKKAGKSALRVKEGFTVVPASPVGGTELEGTAGSRPVERRPAARVPTGGAPGACRAARATRFSRSPAKKASLLVGICVLAPEQGLRIDSGTRHMVIKPEDLDHYAGRAAAGAWRCLAVGERWIGWRGVVALARDRERLAHAGVLGEHDLGLVQVVALHVGDAELEQHGHRVRVLDALRDRRHSALVGRASNPRTRSCSALSVARLCISEPSIFK